MLDPASSIVGEYHLSRVGARMSSPRESSDLVRLRKRGTERGGSSSDLLLQAQRLE